MQRVTDWAILVAILLAGFVAGEILEQPLSPLLAFTAQHERTLLLLSGAAAAVGWLAFMGGFIYMIFKPQPHTHPAANVLSFAGRPSTAPPVLRSESSGRLAAGRALYVEASFHDVKDAWRTGDWWSDPQWRVLFIIIAGALLLWAGLFALFLVVGPLSVRLLVGGMMLYAAIRLAYDFARA